jgi:hypothetical protein
MKLRDKILNAKDIREETLYVQEWDVELLIKGMTGKERANFMKKSMKGDKLDFEAMYPALVIACAFDPEDGQKAFQEADKDAINTKSASAVEKVAKKAMELSGLGEEEQAKAKK